MLLPHMCQKQICPLNAKYMPHIPTSSGLVIRKLCQYIPHVTSLHSVMSPQALVYIHFTLFSYALIIYACHIRCMSHCTSNITYMSIPHYCTYISNKTSNHNFIYPAISIYVPASNMPLKCHMYANCFMCRYETTMSAYIPHMNSMK